MPLPQLRWPHLSIRSTVLLAIAVAVLLPTLMLWHVEQRLSRETQIPLIDQGRQSTLTIAASSMVEPLWSLDELAIHGALRKLLASPGVDSVRLTEKNNPLSKPVALVRPGAVHGKGVLLSTRISREGEALGDLEVWFDPHQLDAALAGRSRATAVLVALQVLVGALALLAVLTHRLLKPIQQLKQQASDIASRADVPPVAWDRADELGQLGQHLNDVHAQIDGLFDQLETQKAELEKIALHDGLTGLPNRALFRELTRGAVAAAERDGGKLALLFIDLDRFKAVNDTLGHAAGDALLLEMARRLKHGVRASDVVCRHSGDEFTVLLRDANLVDELAATADRLLKAIEQPVTLDRRDVQVSASIGIALYPDDAQAADELVQHADTAMYAAKHMGKARYSFFRAEFNQQLQATMQLEKELKAALARDEFVLHYQPQVDAADGTLVGCEALIRWNHPQRGLVPPGQFIGAAEASGLIGDLGAWTIRAACAQIARWRAQGTAFGSIAVNVSALEFRHHRLVDTLTRAMDDFGVQPHELEIEITESVLMTDTDTTQRIVEKLHALGLKLAVDDFGTGYSSLAYLKRLRPGKIKIDRSFIKGLPDDENDRVLVRAVLQLAGAMGISVVAEGVETQAQQHFLHQNGCQVLQGYLLGRPMPPDDFAARAPRTRTELELASV
ncbi:MAG: putative bifunctional diguanylate cyclase/phosphodiesterase [Aquabacterium sp.]